MYKIPTQKEIMDNCKEVRKYDIFRNSGRKRTRTIKGEKYIQTLLEGIILLKEDGCTFYIKDAILFATKGTFKGSYNLDKYCEYVRNQINMIINYSGCYRIKKDKKINPYKYVSDELNSKYRGVLYQDGYRIATDTNILCLLKTDYDPELEGKMFDSNGEEVILHFPIGWQRLIPSVPPSKTLVCDWKQIKIQTSIAKQTASLLGKLPFLKVILSSGEIFWPSSRNTNLFIDFLKAYPTSIVFMMEDSGNRLIAVDKDGNKCLWALTNLAAMSEDWYIHEVNLYNSYYSIRRLKLV